MIKQIKILKNGIQTHGARSDQFDSLESFEAWKQSCVDSNAWGLPERQELDEMGEPTGAILPAEYEIVIEDITTQIEQEAINKEALAYLASTDWVVTKITEKQALGLDISELLVKYGEILQQREIARNKII